ncbi:hypothetical protein D6C77_02696 [Aureobasidium pullulans]|nr:hypothetical protein D6C77_02696 [Aureobasidium pullulans]
MASTMSNKRQRVEPPTQYQHGLPFGYPQTLSQQPQHFQQFQQHQAPAIEINVTNCTRTPEETGWVVNSVHKLDETTLRKLAILSALSHQDMYIALGNELQQIEYARTMRQQEELQAQQEQLAKENAQIIDFRSNVNQVDYVINEKWSRLSGSKQYDKAGDAAELVNDEITEIVGSVAPHSNSTTKINAVLALCDIGSIVAAGGDCIGAEVRKQVGYDEELVNALWTIVETMSAADKMVMTAEDIQLLEAFDKERKGYCVFDGFDEVLEHFKKAVEDPSSVQFDEDDDYGDIDEQALLNKSDAIEGTASQPITL